MWSYHCSTVKCFQFAFCILQFIPVERCLFYIVFLMHLHLCIYDYNHMLSHSNFNLPLPVLTDNFSIKSEWEAKNGATGWISRFSNLCYIRVLIHFLFREVGKHFSFKKTNWWCLWPWFEQTPLHSGWNWKKLTNFQRRRVWEIIQWI